MKQLGALKSKIDNKTNTIAAITTLFFMTHTPYAQAAGLSGITDVIKKFKDDLVTIIPIFAAVLLLCLAIGYAGRYIEKDTFVRWAIGVAVAGSASQIATMLFGANG